MSILHTELLSFFFKDNKLIRMSTDGRELVREGPRKRKKKAHAELLEVMNEYLQIKPEASMLELAYALKNSYFEPPRCQVCNKLVNFCRDNWSANCSISCSLKNEEVKLKKQEASLKKWGVKHQFQREESVKKKEEYWSTQNITREKTLAKKVRMEICEQKRLAAIREKEEWLKDRKYEKSKPYIKEGFIDLVYGKKDRIISVTCSTCKSLFLHPRTPQCFICHAPARESMQWQFMKQFPEHIRDLRIPNGDKKFKLDAAWIEHKLAFEFNGLYWHSSTPQPGGKLPIDKFYHQTKMLAAKAAGYRLITIWEDRAKDELFSNHLKSLFDVPKKIHARKCKLVHLTNKEIRLFLNEHHRDGAVNGGSVHLGLMHEDELISVATFGKNRFKGVGFELFRLATKLGIVVVGGISKLISNFRKLNPNEKLTTYSDAEWGWGDGYLKAGGTLIGLTKPGYFYYDTKNHGRAHRLKLSKGNFEKFTGIAWDESLNEMQNAAKAKCYQIWNCGNWKFEWPHHCI